MADEPLALGGDDSPWAHDLPIADPAPLPATWAPASAPAKHVTDPGEARWGRPADHGAPAGDPPGVASGAPASAPAVAPSGSWRSSDDLDALGAPPPVAEAPTPGHRHRRTALVIGLVGLFGAAAVGSQIAGGSDDGASDVETAPSTTAPGASLEASTTAAGDATTPSTVMVRGRPRLRPPNSVVDRLPAPVPEWVTSTVALDPRVTAIAVPTEVIALARDGTLHVIDTSTGTMSSIDSGTSGIDLTVSLGVHDVVLSSGSDNDVTRARVGVPPVHTEVDSGVARVIEGAGEDDFVLVPNGWNPEFPAVLQLGTDGGLATVSTGPLVDFDPWQIQFLESSGQMIVNDTGGVYLIDGNGAATRTSTGDLAFVGPNHFVVRECDEALQCAYVRVDQATGQRDVVDLAALERYGYGDPSSTSLSPDGTVISYFDWMNGGSLPTRNLYDLSTGSDTELVSADQYNIETAWAADSSGMFVIVGRAMMFYDRATGEQIPVATDAVLDDIVAVATRPVSVSTG